MGTHKHTRHSYVNSSIIKMQYFYNRLICKKAAFLCKKAVFLQPVYLQKRAFLHKKKLLFYKNIFL